MKIIELILDELQDFAGFDAVALVEDPAIEINFRAFDSNEVTDALAFQVIEQAVKDLFVDRLPGESRDSYLERCIPKLLDEGYDQDQAAAICYDSFNLFQKKEQFESYTDYPESATNAAKRALEYRDNNPNNDCGTRVGWARANQLANREPISEETIARMASFKRHQQHKDVPYSEGCGGLMWDAWGGTAGIEWASNKLEEIREDLSKENISLNKSIMGEENLGETLGETVTFSREYKFATDDEQMRVVGPAMVPNKLILRIDQEGNPYYVYFTSETIRKIAYKMMKEKKLDQINLEHNQESIVSGYLEESWILDDPENDKAVAYGFTDLPKGSWMVQYKIEDPEVWKMVKEGLVKGLSIEGYFADRLVQH